MSRRKIAAQLSFITLLVTSPAAAAPDLYKIDPDHTSVVFSVAHTGISYTYGFFRNVSGQYILDESNPAGCRFRLLIKADSLDTNNADRDKHLRSSDFFSVQEFPDILFDSTRCELSNTTDGSIVYKITGDLTLHGVKRPIVVNLRMLGKGGGIAGNDKRTGFLCQIELKRSDFGMTSLLEGNKVGNAVGITVSFEGSQNLAAAAPANAPTR
jgi:polyisoprenoid-binding protein YceI